MFSRAPLASQQFRNTGTKMFLNGDQKIFRRVKNLRYVINTVSKKLIKATVTWSRGEGDTDALRHMDYMSEGAGKQQHQLAPRSRPEAKITTGTLSIKTSILRQPGVQQQYIPMQRICTSKGVKLIFTVGHISITATS
ncbi:hypothetical protein EYF80_039105 [Liparis tanakae]|uniref:Uncharacterized protein n=1 Tax=Liparis tanakae TaxID=230148 RepID=A0A4Z2GAS7_9TELE|nr:hypothetical protein EYF80_039105 [Liparis tanakae]